AQLLMLDRVELRQLKVRVIGLQGGYREATVVLFRQRSDYRGLREMKKILPLELPTALTPSESAIMPERQDTIAERVFTDCWVALKDTLSCIDRTTMKSAATAIARCESLYLFGGVGGSAHIAQEAALKFLFLGFRTLAFVDP